MANIVIKELKFSSDSPSSPDSSDSEWVSENYRFDMVAWADKSEPVDPEDRCAPPDRLVIHTDLLERGWGWERLVAFTGGVDWDIYMAYLNDYYENNRLNYVSSADAKQNPEEWPLKSGEHIRTDGDVYGLAVVAELCLKKEERFMSELNKQLHRATYPTVICSSLIQQNARSKIRAEFSAPAAAALLCIAKEADLMCEYLRHSNEDTEVLIKFCDCIRLCALSLMDCNGSESVAAAAVMVGISKEARLLCKSMRKENQLIYRFNPSLPNNITELGGIRGRMRRLMFCILNRSSVAPIRKHDKIESSSQAIHDSNGNGVAGSKEEKSAGENTYEKSEAQDHKNITDKSKSKRQKNKMANTEITKKMKREEQQQMIKSRT